mgnify:CR=1 FL=1|jgi:hypothetical protein
MAKFIDPILFESGDKVRFKNRSNPDMHKPRGLDITKNHVVSDVKMSSGNDGEKYQIVILEGNHFVTAYELEPASAEMRKKMKDHFKSMKPPTKKTKKKEVNTVNLDVGKAFKNLKHGN